MKKYLFFLLILFSSIVGYSQRELQIQSGDKGLYVNHTVSPKENFYSVGRLYSLSPKEIAAFNSLDMIKGLEVGQTIKIPLEATNFSQKNTTGVPVYYVVGEKEGLYRVSLKNNKVLMANLRKWNHLANDNIATGTKLIVGYIVSPELQNSSNNTVAQSSTTNMNTAATVVKNPPVTEQPKHDMTIEKKVDTEEKSVVKSTPPVSSPVIPASVKTSDAGYFKNLYEQQIKAYPLSKDQTVTSGIFKTASGWQDGKYYALMDGVEPGTIVRIINPTNNKAIYAKVLGTMTGIRQNQGLELRISNAGATALDVADTDKFIVRVIY